MSKKNQAREVVINWNNKHVPLYYPGYSSVQTTCAQEHKKEP